MFTFWVKLNDSAGSRRNNNVNNNVNNKQVLGVCIQITTIFETMELEKLYTASKKRHGQLNRDVVHDMYCKFGSELPSIQYVTTCIKHAKPDPIQHTFELYEEIEADEPDTTFDETYNLLSTSINIVRDRYEEEVDTFLACYVNEGLEAFSKRSGISRSVLEKICKFAKYEILKEFNRVP